MDENPTDSEDDLDDEERLLIYKKIDEETR